MFPLIILLHVSVLSHRFHPSSARVQVVPASGTNDGGDFKCAPVFKKMAAVVAKEGASLVKKIKGTYSFKVTDGPGGKQGTWFVDLKNGNGAVRFGDMTEADCTITMTDDNLTALMTGKLSGIAAFFQGKLSIKGSWGLAMKLKKLKPPKSKR
ncbi:sterol carrier protein 2-like [Lineus longissimus]|uniref:sterol carrier protein 2-like n=1 Tax=Lineus longissimus TaxID=88925 RepID=UPI00315D7B6D